MKVVFLDRDGVINRDREDGYLTSAEELEPLPGAIEGVRLLAAAGYRVVIVSNQQAVALGLLTPSELDRMEARVRAWLGEAVLGVYHATGLRGEDPERKPSPAMLLRAGREHGFDPAGMFFVGDRESDMAAARAAGARPLLVLTGKTRGGWRGWASPPEAAYPNLVEAARAILAAEGGPRA